MPDNKIQEIEKQIFDLNMTLRELRKQAPRESAGSPPWRPARDTARSP